MSEIVNNTMLSLMDNKANPVTPSILDEVIGMLNFVLSSKEYNMEAINFVVAIGNLNKIAPNFSYNVTNNSNSNFQKLSYNANKEQLSGGNILVEENVNYITLVHESTHAIFNLASNCQIPSNYNEVIKKTIDTTKKNKEAIDAIFDEYMINRNELAKRPDIDAETNKILNKWEKDYGMNEYREIESACKTGVILNIRKKFNLKPNVTINDLLNKRSGNIDNLINDMYNFIVNRKKIEIFGNLICQDKYIATVQCLSDMLCSIYGGDALEYGNNKWDQINSHSSYYYTDLIGTYTTIQNGKIKQEKKNIGEIRKVDEQLANFSSLKVLGQDAIIIKYFGLEYYNMMNNLYSKTINDAINYEKINDKIY